MEASTAQKKGYLLRFAGGGGMAAASGLASSGATASARCAMAGSSCRVSRAAQCARKNYVLLEITYPNILRAYLAWFMSASASSILRKSRHCSVNPFCKPGLK